MRPWRLLGWILLAGLIGCEEQTAQQMIEERLEKHTPPATPRSEVLRYVRENHAEVVKDDDGHVLVRFRKVKSTLVCREDVQVEFQFGSNQRLTAHHSEGLRVCL